MILNTGHQTETPDQSLYGCLIKIIQVNTVYAIEATKNINYYLPVFGGVFWKNWFGNFLNLFSTLNQYSHSLQEEAEKSIFKPKIFLTKAN